MSGAGMRKEWIDVDAGPYGKANAEHLRKRVIEVRRQLVQEGPPWTRGDAGDFERVTVPKRDCDAIRDLLIAEGVEKVVEIGLAYGSSALAIGEALASVGAEQPAHIIVDPLQATDWSNVGLQLVQSAGLDAIARLVQQPSSMARSHGSLRRDSARMPHSSTAATDSTRSSSISISCARSFGQAESSFWTTTGGPRFEPRSAITKRIWDGRSCRAPSTMSRSTRRRVDPASRLFACLTLASSHHSTSSSPSSGA